MKTATATIKSQIAVMSGKVPSAAPQSHLARFIAGEIKGGESKHDYAMGVVHSAIEQALKGNQRDIPEAVKLVQGKAIKARAYLAGFHVIADSVKPVTYNGKLADAGNASVRQHIADTARHLACKFEIAYLATIENAKVEAAFNRNAKAKTVPPSEAANDGVADGAPAVPVATVDTVVVDIGDSVAAVVQAMQKGLLEAAEIDAIAAALTLWNAAKLEAEQPALQAA